MTMPFFVRRLSAAYSRPQFFQDLLRLQQVPHIRKTVVTISSGNTGTTYAYKVNPAERAKYGVSSANYGGTALTSGTTAISVSAGDVIEVVNFDSSAAVAAGYFTVSADDIAK